MEIALPDVASFEMELSRSLTDVPLFVTPLDNDMVRTTDGLFKYAACEDGKNMGMLRVS